MRLHVHKYKRPQTHGTPVISLIKCCFMLHFCESWYQLSTFLHVPSCGWRLSAFVWGNRGMGLFTEKRKTAAVSKKTVSVRSNSFRIYAFIHVLSRFFVSLKRNSYLSITHNKPEIPHSLKCNVLTLWFSLNIREFNKQRRRWRERHLKM